MENPDNNYDSERRVNIHLRPLFDKACRVTEPFLARSEEWSGVSHTMYARQALRDAFPELTQQDVALLMAAVRRHHSGMHNP